MLLPKAALPLSAADIAISAIRGQGIYGTITRLSQKYGISRQKVYDIRDQGYSAIDNEFECAAYKPQSSFTLEVSEEDMKRAVIAMRVYVTFIDSRYCSIASGDLWQGMEFR